MKEVTLLAIESSCDETSAAVVRNGDTVLSCVINTQIDIHTTFGGVVPEIASRHHIKNITMVLEKALQDASITMENIDGIAFTYGPGLIGSLLIGLEAAKTLAFLYQKPLIPVHHIAGHIYANYLVKPLAFPLIALVVSGGHTDLIYMKDHYSFEKLGGTLDDAVGECYDKVARVIGVGYPGGPVLDKMAQEGSPTYPLPIPLQGDHYHFSFSGLKSAVINLAHHEQQLGIPLRKADLATSFQNVVVESLVTKTMRAMEDYQVNHLIVAGGVAANQGLRGALEEVCTEKGYGLSIPPMKYCTDNAAMIGAAGYFAYQKGIRASLDVNSKSSDPLK